MRKSSQGGGLIVPASNPRAGQVRESFNGIMIEYGWRVLFQSDKPFKCSLTFNVHEDGVERIDIGGGVANLIKNSRKLFSVHELNRVVYYFTEQEKGEP